MPLEVADASRLVVGEGLAWDAASERLYWIGIEDQQVRWLDHRAGTSHVLDLPTLPGTLAPYRDSRVLLAVAEGFAVLDTATGSLEMVAEVEIDSPERRMNDGKCDPFGRMVAGTMTLAEPRVAGPLYRLESGQDGSDHPADSPRVTILRDGFFIPNGLDWPSPDLLWHIDTPTETACLYEYPEYGPLADPVRVLDLSAYEGSPDGMTRDAEGNLWIAFWGGSAVRCFSPTTGALLETVPVPTAQPSNCTFGGPDLTDLYITSAAVGREASDEYAGALFRYPGLAKGAAPARPWSGL